MELPKNSLVASGPVIIENNKVLLNREYDHDGTPNENFMFPGGKVEDFTVSLEENCKREVKEEMGIDVEIIKQLKTTMVFLPEKEKVAILVHYLANRIGEIKPGPQNIEWGWFDIDNLPDNCTPNVYEIIKEYKTL